MKVESIFSDDFTVGFGRLPGDCLPLRILREFRPVLFGGIAAIVRQDIDERVFRAGRILRRPIADARHPVLFENRERVIAKARLEGGQASGKGVINPQLENAGAVGLDALNVSEDRARGERERDRSAQHEGADSHRTMISTREIIARDDMRVAPMGGELRGVDVRIEMIASRGVAQPGSAPALGADQRLPKLLLILHTSNGFNNLGNLLFAQS